VVERRARRCDCWHDTLSSPLSPTLLPAPRKRLLLLLTALRRRLLLRLMTVSPSLPPLLLLLCACGGCGRCASCCWCTFCGGSAAVATHVRVACCCLHSP
jgi:hypothetical protein